MKLKTLGLLIVVILLSTCKNSLPGKKEAGMPIEENLLTVLEELDLKCTKYLYLYTTYNIQAEKDRWLFLHDSIKPGIGGPNLLEEIENHLKRIEIAEAYFKSLPTPLGFIKTIQHAAYLEKAKPPCPCPTPSDTSSCVCKANAILLYGEPGTEVEVATLNGKDIPFKTKEILSISKTRIFHFEKPVSIHSGDTMILRMQIAYLDSSHKLVKTTLDHTQIMRIPR